MTKSSVREQGCVFCTVLLGFRAVCSGPGFCPLLGVSAQGCHSCVLSWREERGGEEGGEGRRDLRRRGGRRQANYLI